MDENSQMLFRLSGLLSYCEVIRVWFMQCCTASSQKELIMSHIDIVAIERHARQLRAAEIRRIEGLFAEHLRVLARASAAGVVVGALAAMEVLRSLFSRNPQALPPQTAGQQVPAKRTTHSVFTWNPEVHHHV
jgi:hypothetical protein